jgi:hypothetical protein
MTIACLKSAFFSIINNNLLHVESGQESLGYGDRCVFLFVSSSLRVLSSVLLVFSLRCYRLFKHEYLNDDYQQTNYNGAVL